MGNCKHENVTFSKVEMTIEKRIFNKHEYKEDTESIYIDSFIAKCNDCQIEKQVFINKVHEQPSWIKDRIDVLIENDDFY